MTRRVDMHTHVFNLRYLPLEGILRRYHVPPIFAKALAKLLDSVTTDRPDDHPALMRAAATAAPPKRSLAMRTPPEMLDDPDVRAALAQIRPRGRQAYAATVHEAIESETAADRLQPLYDQLDSAKPDNIFNSAAEFVSWLHFLTHSEQGIVDVMFSTYPDVEVFVHHMMDLEHYYHPGSCRYEYVSEQIGRMKKLVDKNKGRLVTFVAWSPKRDHDINVVRRALEDGVAVGVKFYPPSGYRADDPLHDSLYDLCGARWPIFSHCTPSGFEAYSKSGLNSDPKYWANVLTHRPDLRLCLAHAGGEEPWFGQKPWVGSFAQTAVDLAVNKANVYLEFGYHDYVLDQQRRAKFAQTLIALLEQHGDSLGKKIVYGTDWHMIEKISGHEQYFADFDQLFSSDPTLAKYKDDFFYNNGVRFMNLPNFLDTRARARPRGLPDPVLAHLTRVIGRAGIVKPARRKIRHAGDV